ncbi:uroporphyrinogen-III synthase [Paenibacillus daejeonensis]|uniref:uroporphyrinogen-III synthase n=1 Tax=Paenibacillus daejeonensis TaxID=135193 RepID=UPI0003740510|nr:uroporphyrinogen-III synthase [Paenibacillus daejeonensis]
MSRLEGKVIAITGPRKAEEMSRMIGKFGGSAVVRPAQGTVFLDDSRIREQLTALIEQPAEWLILTTGVGTEALLQTAEKLGLSESFRRALSRMKLAARGYKTVNVLKKLGLTPSARDLDGTTAGLLREMKDVDLSGRRVALQLYGDPAPRITAMLAERGAICEELLPYRHIPPESDVTEQLIDEICSGAIDAVALTSTVQVRYIMASAARMGRLDEVLRSLEKKVLAVAVGKVTAESLREEGVTRVLYPEEERMGSMVVSMSRYFDQLNETSEAEKVDMKLAEQEVKQADVTRWVADKPEGC